MSIDRVQERGPGHAIRASNRLESCRVKRSCVAACYVISSTAGIIRVVNFKLGVIENVEKLGAKLHLAGLTYLEMFEH